MTFTDPKERARAFGVYGAISGGAMSIGLIMGGMLTQWASWRWTLLVNVPIAVVALAGSRWLVSESKAEGKAHYDLAGTATVTAGLVALVSLFLLRARRQDAAGGGGEETLTELAEII